MKSILESRFQQANNEAKWALFLTLAYMIFWFISAYSFPPQLYFVGIPLWFLFACILTPIGFVAACIYVVNIHFKTINLEYPHES